MAANPYNTHQAYKRADVETASQGKLVVMLFNGAIQRVEEARRALDQTPKATSEAHAHLLRAQEIVAELRSSLDLRAGDVATQLDRVYEYIFHLLVQANLKKDGAQLEEALGHLTTMRDTWAEAFATVDAEACGPSVRINPHGASVMNIEG